MPAENEISFTIPRKRPFKTVLQFKITLIGAEPPIWRRILVPGSYTFYDLHVAIQNAMGWTDSHLHAYEMQGKHAARIESPYAVDEIHEKVKYFTPETMLTKFFDREGDSAVYVYDFGDGWRHEVLLEKIVPKKPAQKYPVCLAGQRACPPENCGGIGGYARCVKAVTGKVSPDMDEDFLNWLGDWNPTGFNKDDVVFESPRVRFLESFEECGL